MTRNARLNRLEIRTIVATAGVAVSGSAAFGQFARVFNLPADAPAAIDYTISDSQFNVLAGGFLNGVTAGAADGSASNVEVNMFDGAGADQIEILDGATLNMYEGSLINDAPGQNINRSLTVGDGAVFNLFGGRTNSVTELQEGSVTNMTGGILGVPSLFAIEAQVEVNGVLNMSDGVAANSIRVGATGVLNMTGGFIDGGLSHSNFFDGEINMSAGRIRTLQDGTDSTADAVLNMHGGLIENGRLRAASRAIDVNHFGGMLTGFQIGNLTEYNLRGGRSISNEFESPIFHWYGGTMDPDWLAPAREFTSTVAQPHGGFWYFYGQDFTIDGVPVSGLVNAGDRVEVTIPDGSTFAGTLSDGTPFEWVNDGDLYDYDGNLMRFMTVSFEFDPVDFTFNTFNDGDPEIGGVGPGLTVEIQSGNPGDWMRIADGGHLIMNGGQHGDFLEADEGSSYTLESGTIDGRPSLGGCNITINGGTLGDAHVFSASVITVNGGIFRPTASNSSFTVTGGLLGGGIFNSPVTQTGGTVTSYLFEPGSHLSRTAGGGSVQLFDGATAELDGNDDSRVTVHDGSSVVIRGGNHFYPDRIDNGGIFGDVLVITNGVNVTSANARATIYGTEFTVDGADVTHLLTEDMAVDWDLNFGSVGVNQNGPDSGELIVTLPDGERLKTYLQDQFGTLSLVLDREGAAQQVVASNIEPGSVFGFGGAVVRGADVGPRIPVAWAQEFTVAADTRLGGVQIGLHNPLVTGPVVDVSIFTGTAADGPITLLDDLGTVDGSDLLTGSGIFGSGAPVFSSSTNPTLQPGTLYFIVAEAATDESEAAWSSVPGEGRWSSINGQPYTRNNSSFGASFRVVDDGVPVPACGPADLAEPFGVLDVDDVDRFIAEFQIQGPAADLANPVGVLDVDDVDAFISGFLAGCP